MWFVRDDENVREIRHWEEDDAMTNMANGVEEVGRITSNNDV